MTIEPLESRIAPATLLPGGKVVAFTDIDNDIVTVKFSKPILTAGNVGTVVVFSGTAFGASGPQELRILDLRTLGASADGVDVSVTVKRPAGGGGNGEIHFGSINASDVNLDTGLGLGIDLGNVLVQGDINYIDAGDSDITTPAAKSITLLGLGQDYPGVASDIHGAVAKIVVRGAVQGHVRVKSGIATDAAQTRIGSLTIGSLVGDASDNSGLIEVRDIGAVTVRGSVLGGTGNFSGRMNFDHAGKMTIGGSIVGGKGIYSGYLDGLTTSGATIGGSIVGGEGSYSGSWQTDGPLRVKENVVGGKGDFSGYVVNSVKSVQIGGSLIGGEGPTSGAIQGTFSTGVFKVQIGGSVIGGRGENSATISGPNIEQVVIGGDLVGGPGDYSGQIRGDGKVRTVKGSVIGRLPASGDASAAAGFYTSKTGIDQIFIGGDFIAANIALGVNSTNNRFGDADDVDFDGGIPSRLGSLVIKGRVGSPGLTYGIEANQIGSVSIGGVKFIDGVGGVNFATGFFIDPSATVKLRAV